MSLDLPGFADPVVGSQACFRALLDAMSRPGTIREAGAGLEAPPPLEPATAATLLTLIDQDATLRLDDAASAAWDWVAFHTGAARAGERPGFVVALALPDFSELHAGDDAEPEASTTLILQVAALGRGRGYDLSGPGVQTTQRLLVAGLPDDFPARWEANRALYPRGIDLVLCAGERLCALPRSVRAAAA
jgi:alpha-D-ribose 1-methylphosphonate 5-triphosphate synthase subunit PhnH